MLPILESVETIFVRLPNWVGDIVMATPVYETLRHNFPEATIIAGVRSYAVGIIKDEPWFNQVIAFDDKKLKGIRQAVSQTKAFKPDMAILLPNSTRSYITTRLTGVKRIYGYKRNIRRFLLTSGPTPQKDRQGIKPIPMQDYYLELCRHLLLDIPGSPRCKLHIGPMLQEEGDALLAGYGINENDQVIGLNPGASFGSSKCWPVEHFAKLAELLQEKTNCKIMLFVGPGEEPIADAIVEKSSAAIINTGPEKIDLAQLKPLIKRCALLVTNDTGPRHYAVAFDVPAVVLMGPTNPLYTATNLDNTRVIRKDLPCSPCHKKVCPLKHHHCMTQISPQEVMQQVTELLQAGPAAITPS